MGDAKLAVLAVVSPYCDAYITLSLAPELPMVFSDLYRTEYLGLGYHELLEKADNTEHHQHHNKPRLHVLPREVLGIRPNLDYGLECDTEGSLLQSVKVPVTLIQQVLL